MHASTVGGRQELKRAHNRGVGYCVKAVGSSAESAFGAHALVRGRRCTVITATTDPCGQLLALPWPEPMKLLTRQRRSARNPLRRGRRRVR